MHNICNIVWEKKANFPLPVNYSRSQEDKLAMQNLEEIAEYRYREPLLEMHPSVGVERQK